MTRKKLTFEDGMQELEGIVRDLEQGQMPLEESFKAFERANALQKSLQEMLDEGDKRIRVLTESGEQALDPDEESSQ